MLSGINNQQPTYSILVGDLNAKLSKWCPSHRDNKARQDMIHLQQLRVTLK